MEKPQPSTTILNTGVQQTSGMISSKKPTSVQPDSKQKIIGNYILARTIGEGSFAKVAIKIIDKEKLDGYALKNIKRETDIMKLLDHPNIIKMFEIIETKKELFIVMEYASGGEVLDYIVARGKLSENEARRFIRQIVSALDYIHSLQIAHRDLKAENFLLDQDGTIKISDFGLSNYFTPTKPTLNTFCGSPVYSAPELLEGTKYTGPEVDTWSLGINLFAMVTGDLPFSNKSLPQLYDLILKGDYQVPFYISPNCKDLLSKLLVVNPKKRFLTPQIKDHPWFNDGLFLIEPYTKPLVDPVDLDIGIVDQIELMGVEKSAIYMSVLECRYDQINGTYNIMRFMKFGADKEGRMVLNRNDNEFDEFKKKSEHIVDMKEKEGGLKKQPFKTGFIEKVDRKEATTAATPGHQNDFGDNLARVMLMISKEVDTKEEQSQKPKRIIVQERRGRASSTISRKGTLTKKDQLNICLPPISSGRQEEGELVKKGSVGEDVSRVPSLPTSSGTAKNSVSNVFLSLSNNGEGRKRRHTVSVPDKTRKLDGPVDQKNFAFNCLTTSSLPPESISEKLLATLTRQNVRVQTDAAHDFWWNCTVGEICFEIEIAKTKIGLFGVRFKRIAGDNWSYKELCTKLTNDLHL